MEAKEVGRKLAGYDEQLGDYFAKEPNVKLGILTNGVNWRFFTDVVNSNVMDKEPFAKWDVLSDDAPPYDVITILQKSKFNTELIRAYAQRQREKNLLVGELTRLLEPAPEFTKLAVANIETRNLTQGVVESWKSIVAGALDEWARQRMLTAALTPAAVPVIEKGHGSSNKAETTQEELDAFETVRRIIGSERPIGYEDSVAYFKMHVAEKPTWVFARLQIRRKQVWIAVPLSKERVVDLAHGREVSGDGGWTWVALGSVDDIGQLSGLFRAAYDHVVEK